MAVILGSKPPIPLTQVVIAESKTFTAPITGRIKVIITGGGGQGAFLANKNVTVESNVGDGTGGGGGGYSEKTFAVTTGETFTITIGAGGATTLAMNDVNSSRVGNAGSNSSFVTASAAVSVNMAANGGGGGQYSASTSSAVTTAGGAGGTASGGDFNFTGGAGGSITRVAGCDKNAAVTGGGSVSITGTAYTGGDVTMTSAVGSQDKIIATGGAGIGGDGGHVLGLTSSDAFAYVSTGGSSTQTGNTQSAAITAGNFNVSETPGAPITDATISALDAQGKTQSGNYYYNGFAFASDSFNGAGGSGAAMMNPSGGTTWYAYAGGGGGFGGGGAAMGVSGVDTTTTGNIRAGLGGVGGGGSGAYSGPFSTSTSASARAWAPGGSGICIIMFV
jgi:hypothetical protein